MRIFILITVFLFFHIQLLSQEIISDTWMEIFCGSENYSSNLEFNLDPIGTIWDVEWPTPYSKIFTIDTDNSSDGGTFLAEPYVEISDWAGYNYLPTPKRVPSEDFGFGLYKLSVMGICIYLDWRDTRYGSYSSCTGHCADIWIKYDGNTGSIYLKNGATYAWGFPVIESSLYKIWDLKNQGVPSTNDVPSFWSNCLVLIPSINNNVHLVWGPNPDLENISGYKIYRAVHSVPNPRLKVYSLVATVNDETFDYIDYDIRLDENGDYIWYYIIAYNSQTESPLSNVVTANGGLYKAKSGNENPLIKYSISQNYPNPFNPTTKISYEIPKASQVKITVYDVLGGVTAEIVNEYKTPGRYEVQFNAEGLPGGIYFYTLTTGNYHQTKKMILLGSLPNPFHFINRYEKHSQLRNIFVATADFKLHFYLNIL